MKIYLDNAATTPLAPEVQEEIRKNFSEFGNPSSLHEPGRKMKEKIENIRENIAKSINAEKQEIIFTSGGTESNNLAIKGLVLANPGKKHIITSKIEHPSVLEVCKVLEKQGHRVLYTDVDKEGIVKIQEIEKAITPETLLVSIMHVNNEIGTIQPIEKIAEICRKKGVYFHTDVVQSFGKLDIDVRKQKIDLLSSSAHKINGPKGIGFLFIRKGVRIEPIVNGGGQERKLRSGTENTLGIIGLGKAAEIWGKNREKKEREIKESRDKLMSELLKIPHARLNGSKENRIFNNINISFKGVEGESLVLMLDKAGICASTGSACSSHSLKPSHILLALGLSPEEAHGSLRLTLGEKLEEKDLKYIIDKIKESVDKLRKISGEKL